MGSIPGLGRSPGGWHGNPLQYSCLENPHGQRSLVGYSPWGLKESDRTEWLSTAQLTDHKQKCFWMLSNVSRGKNHLWLKTTTLVKQSISNFSYFCSTALLLPKMENGDLLFVMPLRWPGINTVVLLVLNWSVKSFGISYDLLYFELMLKTAEAYNHFLKKI